MPGDTVFSEYVYTSRVDVLSDVRTFQMYVGSMIDSFGIILYNSENLGERS